MQFDLYSDGGANGVVPSGDVCECFYSQTGLFVHSLACLSIHLSLHPFTQYELIVYLLGTEC